MAGDVGELHGKRRLEVTVEELVVASAHARRGDLQENLVWLGLGHGSLFDPKRFLVSVHSGCSHLHVIPSFSSDKKWLARIRCAGCEAGGPRWRRWGWGT